MARDFAKPFYKSASWKRTRDAYMNTPVMIRGIGECPAGLCEICFANGVYKPAEIIHHKIHLTPQNISNPEITIGFGNLQRVCRDCHKDIHYPTGYKQRLKFDEQGRVIE